jgi:hypothetical protein
MTGSKYEPLGRHLASISFNEWRATFSEIEEVLGFSLPPSARTHPAWWGNDRKSRSQASAWLEVGWKAAQVDVGASRVVFRREVPLRWAPRHPQRAFVAEWVKNDAPPHSWDEVQAFECRIGFHWQPLGTVFVEADGRLVFPNAPAVPAIYRFRIRHNGTEARYIGETENLARRFGHYRNPGPTQQTNRRINARFLEVLGAGADIGVSTVSAAWTDRGNGHEVADLSSRAVRRMIENAAIWAGSGADIETLNRTGEVPHIIAPTSPSVPDPVLPNPDPRTSNQRITGQNESRSWWRWKG